MELQDKLSHPLPFLPPVITFEELTGDNACYYVVTVCAWVAHQVIPICFQVVLNEKDEFDWFVPSNPIQKRAAVPGTLIGYIGKHLTEIGKAFPQHPDWSNNQDTSWWAPT